MVEEKKGWIKLHVSADTEKIMASRMSLTAEHSHDPTQFYRLITGHEVKVFADKAYDSRKIFNLLRNNGAEAIIPLRKNFSTLSRTSPSEVKEQGRSGNWGKRNGSVSMNMENAGLERYISLD